ncbi:hypothetical protein BpHYR1_052391 [Brachionus plicatilis]|uniref:Uncharacterized protein n=1 Tax=Brachionus plicatilis TaxID=10195 RepID=A0A3M7SWU9_BRAPC|nr:hypothetical protein BpHYR1_052391 [Brachionus plicatilis]
MKFCEIQFKMIKKTEINNKKLKKFFSFRDYDIVQISKLHHLSRSAKLMHYTEFCTSLADFGTSQLNSRLVLRNGVTVTLAKPFVLAHSESSRIELNLKF